MEYKKGDKIIFEILRVDWKIQNESIKEITKKYHYYNGKIIGFDKRFYADGVPAIIVEDENKEKITISIRQII